MNEAHCINPFNNGQQNSDDVNVSSRNKALQEDYEIAELKSLKKSVLRYLNEDYLLMAQNEIRSYISLHYDAIAFNLELRNDKLTTEDSSYDRYQSYTDEDFDIEEYSDEEVVYDLEVIRKDIPRLVEMLQSPEIQKAVKVYLLEVLSESNVDVDEAIKLKNVFFVTDEVLESSEIQSVVKSVMQDCMRFSDFDRFKKLQHEFNISVNYASDCISEHLGWIVESDPDSFHKMVDVLCDTEAMNEYVGVKFLADSMLKEKAISIDDVIGKFKLTKEQQHAAALFAIKKSLHSLNESLAEGIKQQYFIDNAEFQEIIQTAIVEKLHNGDMWEASCIVNKFSLDPGFIESEKVQVLVKKAILEGLMNNKLRDAANTVRVFKVSRETIQSSEIQEVAQHEFVTALRSGSVNDALLLFEVFNLEILDPAIKAWFEMRDMTDVPLAIKNSKEAASYVALCFYQGIDFDEEAITARATHNLSQREYATIALEHKDSLQKNESGKYDAEQVAQKLESDEFLIPDENIRKMFELGRKFFGVDIIIKYSSRVDMERHDALYFMPAIIELQQRSGLDKKQFAANILLQVSRDGARYEEGSAHHHFATIAQHLSKVDLKDIIERAKKYGNIKKLQTLLEDLEGSCDAFSSWKMLKKMYEIDALLSKTEIVDKLNDSELSSKLRNFIEKLAFHPNISMRAVLQFWQHTARFLDVDDDHTELEIDRVKKPSNYLSLPFLGLTAVDLRDAYVDGVLDELQTISPMERVYTLGVDNEEQIIKEVDLHRDLVKALGKRKDGVKGLARKSKKMFQVISAFCKQKSILLTDLIDEEKGVKLLQNLDQSDKQNIREMVFNEDYGLEKDRKEVVYRIKIGEKSDPDMVVAGNDTASCMPFGSGKNNVYMFNPNCTQLVLQRQMPDGSWRTAAQSVMTINAKSGIQTPKMIAGYRKHKSLKHLFKPEDFAGQRVLTCDNIEVAKNEEGDRLKDIKEVYVRFFKEYLEEHAVDMDVDATKVVVGTGYTPDDLGLKRETNTYVPLAPMGYSDNVHNDCFVIETGLKRKERKIRKNIRELETKDSLAAAYIEGKAYHDNDSLLEYLHKIQNNIIGKEIADDKFDRPNLSFIAEDGDGVPQAYLIAYEGVVGVNRVSQVYIADLAADPESKMSAPALVRTFLRTYFENYGTEDREFLPIYTNAREKTSYQWILKLAKIMASKNNAIVEIEEESVDKIGNDKIYNLRIYIGRDRIEIDKQKNIMAGIVYGSEDEDYESEEYGEDEY